MAYGLRCAAAVKRFGGGAAYAIWGDSEANLCFPIPKYLNFLTTCQLVNLSG